VTFQTGHIGYAAVRANLVFYDSMAWLRDGHHAKITHCVLLI